MSSGEIYNAILQVSSGKEGELWPRRCIHRTGDIIYALPGSESRSSRPSGGGEKCWPRYPRDNPPFPSRPRHPRVLHKRTWIRETPLKPVLAGCGCAASNLQQHVAGSEERTCTFTHKITPQSLKCFLPDVSDLFSSKMLFFFFLSKKISFAGLCRSQASGTFQRNVFK